MDRNTSVVNSAGTIGKSLSARRAWIEITQLYSSLYCDSVALRKESVDRNYVVVHSAHPHKSSLSARRAWIEMLNPHHPAKLVKSLSARRAWIEMLVKLRTWKMRLCRSPQGERG